MNCVNKTVGVIGLILALICVSQSGCAQRAVYEPDYSRPLGTGERALELVPESQWPDLSVAYRTADGGLARATKLSLDWFNIESTKRFFPLESITHDQARASVFAFDKVLSESRSAEQFVASLQRQFDLYQSVGWDSMGTVLYTGYYAPVLPASRQRTGMYRYPLYQKPSDLAVNPATGEILGRRVGETIVNYPVRREIEATGMLRGLELVYLKDKFDVYMAQLQGSAKLAMADGTEMFVGYAGSNGHEYTSVSKKLVADGELRKDELNLAGVRRYFRNNPEKLDTYLNMNDRYVFMKEYDGSNWPAGSLGFQVTPMRSLATDKSVFPRGGVVFVKTVVTAPSGGRARLAHFMLDQDTGGAIRAAGRADIFMGIGDEAETMAGRQYDQGQLYYLFLKPAYVPTWRQRQAREAVGVVNVNEPGSTVGGGIK